MPIGPWELSNFLEGYAGLMSVLELRRCFCFSLFLERT